LSIFIIILKNNAPKGALCKILSFFIFKFVKIMSRKRKRTERKGNLHLVVVHKLNGFPNSAVLYRGIVGDEKSVGTGPNRVVVVAAVVAVDVDRGIYKTRPSGNICIFDRNER
jgi:hypothetical protein